MYRTCGVIFQLDNVGVGYICSTNGESYNLRIVLHIHPGPLYITFG